MHEYLSAHGLGLESHGQPGMSFGTVVREHFWAHGQ